ncbi:MAG: hypothetical protein L0Y75_08290 [Acidobacteria bacterium]|nr:hypothetical protein [Acidobacteriota bacterium]
MDSVKDSLHHTIDSLSEEEARALWELIKRLQQRLSGTLLAGHENGMSDRSDKATWDDVFAQKLQIGKQPFALDLSEVSGDDFLF